MSHSRNGSFGWSRSNVNHHTCTDHFADHNRRTDSRSVHIRTISFHDCAWLILDCAAESVFCPKRCTNPSYIGVNCTVPSNPCVADQNYETIEYDCTCSRAPQNMFCAPHRPRCKPYVCFNSGTLHFHSNEQEIFCCLGTCHKFPNRTFYCKCPPGWNGSRCETMEHDCDKPNTCLNNGVCRPMLRNFTCECLAGSFYGRHCQHTATRVLVYRIVAKSFSYVAILAMVSCVLFFVIMDILKYCFGIDPVREERERYRRERQARRRRRPVIQRFVYVNPPSQPAE